MTVFKKIKVMEIERQHLQDDPNKLTEWSEKWQMMFNFGKCKRLHTGHGNEDAHYTMGGTVLKTTVKENDLGLTISADMDVIRAVWNCTSEGKPNSWIN